MMLTRVATEQAMPFDVHVPNAETIAAIEAGERGEVESVTLAELQAVLDA